MKITILNKNKKDVILTEGIIFIHLNEGEAVSLIRSLAEQIEKNNCNVNRMEDYEDYDDNGNYFSIGVIK